MCGIVGAVANQDVLAFLLQGLQRMEYRGYDSAGLAIVHQGVTTRIRRAGKVRELVQAVAQQGADLPGRVGIAHTRWATHGVPNERNAHPQMAGGRILVVHNGIVENFSELKSVLEREGEQFESDTDTEVIAKLVYRFASETEDLLHAVWQTTKLLTGSYAIAVLDAERPEQLVAVECGAPIVLGVDSSGSYLASDPLALLGVTSELIYMHSGELALLTASTVRLFDQELNPIKRDAQWTQLSDESLDRGECPHYMLKEILEEPEIVTRVVDCGLRDGNMPDFSLFGELAPKVLSKVRRVYLVACGSSCYAAMLGRLWLESWAQLPCTVELASEFRYHSQPIEEGTLLVVISQSGETADTLAALRVAKAMGFVATMAICNVQHSSIMREAELHWFTRAGVEIGVASTKAFVAQLLGLALLALSFRRLSADVQHKVIGELQRLPTALHKTLALDAVLRQLAEQLYQESHLFYLGRTDCYPIALEGALKLKELSYIHAEGLAAGELKHGTLALIERGTPVIALVMHNGVERKIIDNLHEVAARGGRIIVFADRRTIVEQPEWQVVYLPEMDEMMPLLMLLPTQLLAYHIACLRGCDVDQPRNLAKSVTVE